MKKPDLQIEKRLTFRGHRNGIFDLEQIDKRSFVSASGDGQVVVWSLDAPEEGQVVARVDGTVYVLHVFDGRLLVGENNRAIHLIDLSDRSVLRSVEIKAPMFAMASDANFVLVGTGAGELFVFDHSLNFLRKERFSTKSLRSIQPWKEGWILGYSDNIIRVLSSDFEVVRELEGHTLSVFSTAFRPPQQELLVSIGRDAHIKIWDVNADFELIKSIPAHMYAINDVVFSSDGQYFFTGSMDKTIKIWDAANFTLLKVVDKLRHDGHTNSVNQLLWMAEANLLLTCSDDRTIAAWDIKLENR